jgi:hypothetical protein
MGKELVTDGGGAIVPRAVVACDGSDVKYWLWWVELAAGPVRRADGCAPVKRCEADDCGSDGTPAELETVPGVLDSANARG